MSPLGETSPYMFLCAWCIVLKQRFAPPSQMHLSNQIITSSLSVEVLNKVVAPGGVCFNQISAALVVEKSRSPP